MADLAYDSESNNPSGTFLRDTIRPLLLPYVLESCRTTVVSLQAACGVIAPPKVKADHEGTRTTVDVVHEKWGDPTAPMFERVLNGILALISRLGCALGGEQFYITCFPFLFWNVDRALARRVIFLWVTMMYVGQGIKDHLKLPRPGRCNPNVRVLEDVWAIEYGFPSTHVMAVLSQVGILVYFGWQYEWWAAIAHPWIFSFFLIFGVVAWVGFSRIYVGVHSLPDVIGGLFLGLFLLWTFIQIDDAIDNWLVTSPASLYTPTLFCLAILMLYPRPKKFTPCYGDSAMVVGAGNGVISSSWLAQDFSRFPLPLSEMESFSMWAGAAFYRAIIGFIVLGLVRLVFKTALFSFIPRILPPSDRKPTERYSVVVPTKFICYSMVGFAAVTVVPLILPFFPTWW